MIFTIVSKDELNSAIPKHVIEHLGYIGEPKLIDKVLVCSKLTDGNYAISVNLKAEGKQCAWTDLSEQEIELAKMMYQELLTIEEYKQLDFESIE